MALFGHGWSSAQQLVVPTRLRFSMVKRTWEGQSPLSFPMDDSARYLRM
jgi:hypothetical protein